jgi:excinuclease ABC subunit C
MSFAEIDISNIPKQTGVYLMKDASEKVLYVGKARDLRARVNQYLQGSDERALVEPLRRSLSTVDWIVTDNEKEAFLLENTLIKRHKPRFNIQLRDDKTYVHLVLNREHPFPRVEVVRRPRKNQGLLFGPYDSAHAVRSTLKLLQKLFPLRTCSDVEFRHRTRPCLEYQMGRCLAPCVGYVNQERYRKMVDEVILFLKGKKDPLLKELQKNMQESSEQERYEEAARYRDQIAAIEKTLESQMVSNNRSINQDVFGIYLPSPLTVIASSPLLAGSEAISWRGEIATSPRQGGAPRDDRKSGKDEGIIEVLHIREGQLVGAKSYPVSTVSRNLADLLSSFVNQYYGADRSVPQEILLPLDFEGREVLASILSERVRRKVEVWVPQRGDRKKLLEMAERNALYGYQRWKESGSDIESTLGELKVRLHLQKEPRIIEAYDISNIQGKLAVGSKVSFVGGKAAKEFYRRYRIRTVKGANDFAMMYEVLSRRFKRGLEEGDLPDLIVIDGGKGQLKQAQTVLKELGVLHVELLGLAKAKSAYFVQRQSHGQSHGKIDRTIDRVYLQNRKNPVMLPKNSPALLLLMRIRDEAHRFAITYHKNLRNKAMVGKD